MAISEHSGGGVIAVTFAVALLLSVLPHPDWAQSFRPQWVALTLIYWTFALPERVGVGVGFSCGILLDALTGTVLGQHALSLSLIAYVALKTYQRARLYPLWQQAMIVLILLLAEHLIALWIRGALKQPSPGLVYWMTPVTGALLWPWLFVLLRGLRRRFHVR